MTPPKPMLAADLVGDPAFPLLVQPKLDGFRCLARREVDGWVLYSRRGNVLALPHITDALDLNAVVGLVLDGELYTHGLSFQRLTSMIRQRDTGVEFHVFDYYIEGPYIERPAGLRQTVLATFHFTGPVKRVNHHTVHFQHQLDQIYADTLAAGYEGVVLRDPAAAYEPKRSWALLKLKPHYDSEFLVIGWRTAKNAPHLVVLEVRNDLTTGTFDVCFPSLVDEPSECVGRMLTCRFSGRTDALLPRHAVAMRFRDEQDIDPAQPAFVNMFAGSIFFNTGMRSEHA